jgi:radical SAM protein with 4Fe4S-binding SPASM domain
MGTHDMQCIPYAQFGGSLNQKALTERIPLSGTLEVTFRCNLRCAHCYCNLPANDPQAMKEELTTDEVFNVLDQIAEAGCLWLLITGGEPLVRDDFLDIYTHAKKKGFIIVLFTNGTLITPEIADYLAEWPPYGVEISLYGISRETHEKITGKPGSFESCKRGIQLLLERKVCLDLKTAVMTLNKDELFHLKAFAEKLGLKFRFDPVLTPRLDGGKAPCRLRLTPREVVALDEADDKRAEEWKKEFKKSVEQINSDRLLFCGAGLTQFHIDPYGKVGVCDMCRFDTYDLRSISFRQGWEREIPRLLNVRRKTHSPCQDCAWIDHCNYCAGWSWMENGNLEEPMDYSCQITRLRAEIFG